MNLPELTPPTRALFPLPEHAQRGENISSMVNFAPEYRRLMDALRITRIVEIGSEAGVNTQELLGYARGRGAELVTVDPAAVRFPFDAEKEPCFTFFRETSAEFLAKPIPFEALFLDGDHNYETVLADLETLHSTRARTGIKILFLHDVSWPWARRDIYYDPARVAHPHAFHAENTASPYVEGSPGLPPAGYMTADAEGGPRNGVLTAVEDFLGSRTGWEFRRIPVLYGIGLLLCRENLDSEELSSLLDLIGELDSHRELLSVLELNRVENLCRIAGLCETIRTAGEVWKKDHSYLGELDDRVRALTGERDALAGERDALRSTVAERDRQLGEAAEEHRRDQARIGELDASLAELTRERDALAGERDALAGERDTLRSTVAERGRQLGEAAEEHRRDQARIGELDASLAELTRERDALAGDRDALAGERDALRNTVAERDRQLGEAAEEHRRDQARIGELDASFAGLARERDALRDNVAECGKKLEEAGAVWRRDQAYISEVNGRLAALSAERDALRRAAVEQQRNVRRLSLDLPPEAWRCRDPLFRRLLPGGLRNRRRLGEARRLLASGEIALLSLDIFDTLLLRDRTAELERFSRAGQLQQKKFPRIAGREEFYEARALAHQLAYQSVLPVEGCREASAERIFSIMADILGLPGDAVPVLMETELEYEIGSLRPNPLIREVIADARSRGIPVIAVSDMYWSGKALGGILARVLPEAGVFQKIYSSSDYGVSKASGLLFDRILGETGCSPEALLHLGDNCQADFLSPFVRHGIRSIWTPRSSLHYHICGNRQKRLKQELHGRNIFHGL